MIILNLKSLRIDWFRTEKWDLTQHDKPIMEVQEMSLLIYGNAESVNINKHSYGPPHTI